VENVDEKLEAKLLEEDRYRRVLKVLRDVVEFTTPEISTW
jgi:hypothetical protein